MSAVLGVGTCVVISLLQDRGLRWPRAPRSYLIGDPELFFWRKIAGVQLRTDGYWEEGLSPGYYHRVPVSLTTAGLG